ncbi:MAG: NAD(+) synthase [Oligoflexales bacterium]
MIKNIEKFLHAVAQDIRQRTDIAIIGMSGGADSTLVAALCSQALGPENVLSVHMPCTDLDIDFYNARSIKIANRLRIKKYILPIADSVHSLEESLKPLGELSQVNQGNIRSRVRMSLLYGVCHHHSEQGKKARVIGTGNLSEDFIGYDTKGGDALADFFPIGQLFKSEVYQLLDWCVAQSILCEDMIDRTPSAALWEGQTDEEELGFSYNEMEPSVRRYLTQSLNDSDIDQFVKNRHLAHKHKHEAPPVFNAREFCI